MPDRVDPQFCPNCDVSMDLHPDDSDTSNYEDCDIAERKAALIESFGVFRA